MANYIPESFCFYPRKDLRLREGPTDTELAERANREAAYQYGLRIDAEHKLVASAKALNAETLKRQAAECVLEDAKKAFGATLARAEKAESAIITIESREAARVAFYKSEAEAANKSLAASENAAQCSRIISESNRHEQAARRFRDERDALRVSLEKICKERDAARGELTAAEVCAEIDRQTHAAQERVLEIARRERDEAHARVEAMRQDRNRAIEDAAKHKKQRDAALDRLAHYVRENVLLGSGASSAPAPASARSTPNSRR